ncbi:porin family protein [Sulfurovum sp. zt1-1]|uniref:Porin family protein n=1 Tax=Sulfurovum zhangzhouensis TaxID=3019067 RepID=A0ABT7QVF1_9BACT|nr:porin family protein [Sulfurovum zhangzhouensis]MDM5270828.1 porin family protein [Sulfurovum zhangzhouensis]
MKKGMLSLVSIMALSGIAYGGGDMGKAVEPYVEMPEVEVYPFYIGVGMGDVSVDDETTDEKISATTVVLQAGYEFNSYVALEGRYTLGLGACDYDSGTLGVTDGYDGDYYSWGVYVKPMYPIGNFDIYGLLGYGQIMLEDLAGGDAVQGGFHWGLGVSYALSGEISVFADYVSLYDDKGLDKRAELDDIVADTWTVGLTYKF